MLIITRATDESFTVTPPGYPPIKIMVVRVRGDRVRIGIEAPQDVVIHRDDANDLEPKNV